MSDLSGTLRSQRRRPTITTTDTRRLRLAWHHGRRRRDYLSLQATITPLAADGDHTALANVIVAVIEECLPRDVGPDGHSALLLGDWEEIDGLPLQYPKDATDLAPWHQVEHQLLTQHGLSRDDITGVVGYARPRWWKPATAWETRVAKSEQ